MNTLTFGRTLAALSFTLIACLSFGAVAADPGAKTSSIAVLDYTMPVPAAWVAQQPANTMRLLQFQVPGVRGAGDAEAIVFYFGQGGGGPVDANIARWKSQFSSHDGKPVEPIIRKFEVSGMPVTTVELNGTYARGVGMGPAGPAKPNQTLLAAVIETPKGNITIHLHGPKSTVAANRRAFDAMVQGFK